MAGYITMLNMVTAQQRVKVAQTLPGLYCRTQISK